MALLAAIVVLCLDAVGRGAMREGVPVDAETGVMRGAEPVRMSLSRDRACLLLHGWISSPADFGDLPRALDRAGWDVYAPLHVGHGTTPADLKGIGAEELLGVALEHYVDLRARYDRVALVGFSMGGAVATILAAEAPPEKLVLVAPFYSVRYKWYYVLPARWWAKLLAPFVCYVPRSRRLLRVNRPEGRGEIVTYGAFPMSALQALFELGDRAVEHTDPNALRMPVLLVYSAGDDVCAAPAMEAFFVRLPGAQKRKVVFERSNHHVLHDYDREAAVQAIIEFLGGR
jgi:carboxylesterase